MSGCAFVSLRIRYTGQMWWLKSVIPATWEMKMGKMVMESQPGQKVHETPSKTIKR
jgi:hypothetical protein